MSKYPCPNYAGISPSNRCDPVEPQNENLLGETKVARTKRPVEYYWKVRFDSRQSFSVFDMLRYDGARIIDCSGGRADNGNRYETLILQSDRPPTIARWKSFGITPTIGDNQHWPEDNFRPGYGDPLYHTDRYSVR